MVNFIANQNVPCTFAPDVLIADSVVSLTREIPQGRNRPVGLNL